MEKSRVEASVVWRALERPGLEHCRLWTDGLEGDVVVVVDGRPCVFTYRVQCDASWRTQSVEVEGWIGTERYSISFTPDTLDGCIDADLGFTPSTNTLPIRRLNLAIGEEASVSAAWLRFPQLTLERLDQTYRRTGERTYRYTSATGFTGELEVDEHGLVITYEGGWARE
jgi:hypothetical protein